MSIIHWAKGHELVKRIKSLSGWWIKERKIDILYICGRRLGHLFACGATNIPESELGGIIIFPQTVVCTCLHEFRIAHPWSSSSERTKGKAPNKIFCINLQWGKSRTVMLLFKAYAFLFCTRSVYHGIEMLQLGPSSLMLLKTVYWLILMLGADIKSTAMIRPTSPLKSYAKPANAFTCECKSLLTCSIWIASKFDKDGHCDC